MGTPVTASAILAMLFLNCVASVQNAEAEYADNTTAMDQGFELVRHTRASGVKSSKIIQDCKGAGLDKTTFPDMDYALLGYDSLKGYPLAVGHDPGFTLPIFIADYSEGLRTADCMYIIPKGYIAIPDVSCITSFSSAVVRSTYELSKMLSLSAHIKGSGWGFSFSASADYKEASTELSTGESVLIISRASCKYYYITLLEKGPPPFHPVFKEWIIKLSRSNDDNEYVEFFENYGTHYLEGATLGASFTKEYKMSMKDYQNETKEGVNVAVSASYSGLFELGGGNQIDKSKTKKVNSFRKKVTTKTVTVGAPPPEDGNAMKWASTVKKNPLPVSYDLISIENLFTETFMGKGSSVEDSKIDFKKIKGRIESTKMKYCLKLKAKGLVGDCGRMVTGLKLVNTALAGSPQNIPAKSAGDCSDKCHKLKGCQAIDFSKKSKRCQIYKENRITSATFKLSYEATLLLPNMKTLVALDNTVPTGEDRSLTKTVTTPQQCLSQCIADSFCVAFTFCECPQRKQQCTLYSKHMHSLKRENGSTTYLVSSSVKVSLAKKTPSLFFRYENQWYGPPCDSSRRCPLTNSQCNSSRCRCRSDSVYSVKEDICSVDGSWSSWRTQMTGCCSATCGRGTHKIIHTRTCTNPAPRGGGKYCVGPGWKTRQSSCTERTCTRG